MSAFQPHLTCRPLQMIVPLDMVADLDSHANDAIAQFARDRIAKGDPGPLYLSQGVCTTAAAEAARLP